MTIETIINNVNAFKNSVKAILAKVETSSARLMTLEDSYEKIGQLSIKQDDLFRQTLRCIENGLFRAAHVMAWAAFMDFFHNKLAEDGLKNLASKRPNWKLNHVEDLREQSDYQVIEVAEEITFIRRTEKRALHGLLNSRNECAHPEDYYPGLNESLGYVSAILKRISTLQHREL